MGKVNRGIAKIPTPTLASFKVAGSPAGEIGAGGVARAQAFGLNVNEIRRMAALEGLKFLPNVNIGGENKRYYGKTTPYNQPKPKGARLVQSPFGSRPGTGPLSWYQAVKNINYVAPPGKGGKTTAATAPAATPTATTQQNDYNPTPLATETQQQPSLNITMPNMPAAPPPQYSAGGVGADVGTNAAGYRRKKSSAREAGWTSKGTSLFKIAGQSARSSGLNIGI